MNKTVWLLLAFLLNACSENKQPTSLVFVPVLEHNIIKCNKAIMFQEGEWLITQLQFFISNVEMLNKVGKWNSIPLMVTPEQTSTAALLGVNCLSKAQPNWQLTFSDNINVSEMKKIRFAVGLPFEVNHLNPLTQKSPLNDSSMFWVWQTGHKFARIEMQSNSDNWLFHLGSTGCKSPSVMRTPHHACLYPNLFTQEISIGTSKTIIFDLSSLIAKLTLTMESSCQSKHTNKYCQQLFSNLTASGKHAIFREKSHE